MKYLTLYQKNIKTKWLEPQFKYVDACGSIEKQKQKTLQPTNSC